MKKIFHFLFLIPVVVTVGIFLGFLYAIVVEYFLLKNKFEADARNLLNEHYNGVLGQPECTISSSSNIFSIYGGHCKFHVDPLQVRNVLRQLHLEILESTSGYGWRSGEKKTWDDCLDIFKNFYSNFQLQLEPRTPTRTTLQLNVGKLKLSLR